MFKAKKSLSQNFLIDKNICKKIIKQIEIKNRIILEIGPGYGSLTNYIISNNPKTVFLIEKDKNLVKYLQEKYKENKKIQIIEQDILKFNLSRFKKLIIISNLPYNVSTKIILHLYNFNKNIDEMIFMIQKEVAEKFDYNLPKMNKYKFLTYIVSTYYRVFEVSSKVFTPEPKVKSTVVKFVFNKKNYDLDKAIEFSKIIFRNVRKKINNNIKINKKDNLLNKRVNQLTIKDLFSIYNFF